ncbi:hypothetical protein Cgig2_020948 [Carnegiea gigantea]|uniref:Uncharacterized protein n=1 Tax=Carnegiea gigantea TaxID=171969 RepID=A0A9Q1JKC5_9CARY|nr:hypothetical protein Cgig2_020948 [Carnegiea gigantea]
MREYSVGKSYCFSRANLLSLVTALGSGKWLIGPSCGFERVGATGNSNPSATISVARVVRPVCLGTKPTGPNDDLVEELVKAPSEGELREECPKVELREPDREVVLELEEATSTSRVKNAGGGGVLAAGPRGRARLKRGNNIGNLFRLPILILSRDAGHHPAINKGWEVEELWVLILHLGASLPLTDVPTGRAR